MNGIAGAKRFEIAICRVSSKSRIGWMKMVERTIPALMQHATRTIQLWLMRPIWKENSSVLRMRMAEKIAKMEMDAKSPVLA